MRPGVFQDRRRPASKPGALERTPDPTRCAVEPKLCPGSRMPPRAKDRRASRPWCFPPCGMQPARATRGTGRQIRLFPSAPRLQFSTVWRTTSRERITQDANRRFKKVDSRFARPPPEGYGAPMHKGIACALGLGFGLGVVAGQSQTTESRSRAIVKTSDAGPTPSHTNRLAREKSPYLLQHQHNPVDWYAWGAEAFEKARREDKPIFLSIGYSTCHWCHVMERESFENEELARFLNEHFVSIKVDREERPDVDKIYMTFVQATTGQGGWPLNVFLTSELKPFYGGTYFPPDNRYGRPSFLHTLQNIRQLWENRHEDLTNSAVQIHEKLEEAAAGNTSSNLLLTSETVRQAGKLFKSSYDPRHGGFGGRPTFPQPSQP